jgi:hypothetical protein
MNTGEYIVYLSGVVVDQVPGLVRGGFIMGTFVLVVVAAPGDVPTTGTDPDVCLTASFTR